MLSIYIWGFSLVDHLTLTFQPQQPRPSAATLLPRKDAGRRMRTTLLVRHGKAHRPFALWTQLTNLYGRLTLP